MSRADVFNTQGHRVSSLQNVACGIVRVPTEHLPAGLYIVRAQGRDNVSVQKIAVR
ncbi:MAG: T9SS type A sorting domain-containing protein [Fibrobacter sp.]|nr:T9SS type A sorting domain-containing protein [Fibrobacter sp.]